MFLQHRTFLASILLSDLERVCSYSKYYGNSIHLMCNLETIASLQAFRKRHSEAQRLAAQYNSQPTTVDFAHYRSVLKNKAVVDEAEMVLKEFKPVTYDVGAHLKTIETFEAKAVSSALCYSYSCAPVTHNHCFQVEKAKETEEKIDVELKELQATLANIEQARPFDQLTVRV
jgi:F-type H+-transporting ATPase subunit d